MCIRDSYVAPPPSAAGANWPPMNPAVRPPHAGGGMLNRMPMPARQPMCVDPPMYGQQPAGVFQSVGAPQGRHTELVFSRPRSKGNIKLRFMPIFTGVHERRAINDSS